MPQACSRGDRIVTPFRCCTIAVLSSVRLIKKGLKPGPTAAGSGDDLVVETGCIFVLACRSDREWTNFPQFSDAISRQEFDRFP